VLRDLQDRLDVRTVVGNASLSCGARAAGIADADILVALTSSDEVNMMACEVANTLYRTHQDRAHPLARIHLARRALQRRRAVGRRGSAPSSWSPNTSSA
jgi:trk system potassium uptake protein TrkA